MSSQNKISKQEFIKLKGIVVIRFSLMLAIICAFILLPAWTWNYWQAYLYISVLAIPMIIIVNYFLKRDPRFLIRRARRKEKEKQQKPIVLISSIIFISAFIIPGIDKRFGWSHVPAIVSVLADGIVLSGYLLIFKVFRQNSYASRIIEVDEDQKVISSGLYGIVRHPMYLGVIIMFLPMPLALGSYWGLIPIASLPAMLVQRIMTEEKFLLARLEGYKEYCRETRYRLLPFIW